MKFLSHSPRKSVAISALLLSMAAAAFAQDRSTKLPDLQIEGDNVTGLNYSHARVQDFLRVYEKLAGLPLVCDSSVQGTLSLKTSITLSKAEAKRLMEVALLINGFSLVKRDNVIVVAGPGKPTRSVSIPIYFDEKSIPEGESIISFVFDLKYADASALANTLNQYLATGQPYASFLPMPGSRRILVTESTSTVRRIGALIKRIDVESYEKPPEVHGHEH